jgi:hypothetical protein
VVIQPAKRKEIKIMGSLLFIEKIFINNKYNNKHYYAIKDLILKMQMQNLS